MIARPAQICMIIMLFSFPSFAQIPGQKDWQFADSSIKVKFNLQDLRKQVESWKEYYLAAKNDVFTARCFYYLQKIDDRITEQTLFFKNSEYTDSIINSAASSPLLKSIMYALKAKRIREFRLAYLHSPKRTLFNSDYASMSAETLDSLANNYFEKALTTGAGLQLPNGRDLLWITDSREDFLFDPGLADIIYAERIEVFRAYLQERYVFSRMSWLSLSPDELINLGAIAPDSDHQRNRIFVYYKQWIKHHAGNPSVYYYIEALARRDFYEVFTMDTAREKLYENYLQNLIVSPYNIVKAHGVYHLSRLWNQQAMKYNPSAGYSYRYRWAPVNFDTSVKMHYVKSLQLYTAHRQLMENYSTLNHLCLDMKAETERRDLNLHAYNHQIPGMPIMAFLRFRNTPKIHVKIVRWDTWENFDHNNIDPNLFIRQPAVQEKMHDLQLPDDFQWHNTYLKFDPLPAGRYFFLFSDSAITEENKYTDFIEVTVTQIAVINSDHRVFVLDRKTGFPLAGAAVTPGRTESDKGEKADTIWSKSAPLVVNEQGYVNVDIDSTSLAKVTYKGEICYSDINEPYDDLPDEIYDEDYYDELEEFYLDNVQVYIYTDRAIYRPGQKMHYKAIILTHHPKTAAPIAWNSNKMNGSFFKRLFHKNASKFKLLLYDPFGRAADSILLKPDKYGSFAGFFQIPADAATGQWNFDSDDIDVDGGSSGEFFVEEYKRPSFEVFFEKPKREVHLRDSMTIKIIVRSFAGALLNNVLVKYSVSVRGYLPDTNPYNNYRDDDTLISAKGYTNSKGELLLRIHDTALERVNFPKDEELIMLYSIYAQAIDATGESDEAHLSYRLSTRPVDILMEVPEQMERYALTPLEIITQSEFAGSLQKQVQVRILKMPSRTALSEMGKWPVTDIKLYTDKEFEGWFPEMKPAPPADTSKVLVYETSHTTRKGASVQLPSSALVAGEYRIEVICRENGKITGEASRDFAVYDLKANALPGADTDFESLPNNEIKKGDSIIWTTGNSISDVYSIYNIAWFAKTRKGLSKRSDYLLRHEKKGINRCEITMPREAASSLMISHIYIINNQLYIQEHEIFIDEEETSPEIIVEQHRTRMVPRGKETFTVSVKTKNERTVSQLMTTMYDATLDQLRRHDWQIPRFELFDPENYWNYSIADMAGAHIAFYPMDRIYDRYGYQGDLMFDRAPSLTPGNQELMGFVSGVNVRSKKNALNFNLSYSPADVDEVVVVGYGSRKQNNTAAQLAPGLNNLPAPLIRKNFSETAFFYPRVYAGADGYYTIEFTVPESVTSWKWKMLAHTKDARFAYAEKTLVSQLPLMVQPDMPRFLYQGDRLVLKSRITNLDSIDCNGTLQCSIEDAVTGEDVTGKLTAANRKQFSVAGSTTGSGAFEITVPAGWLHPLRIKISALSKSFSDGEEHVIPVQARKILVTQTVVLSDMKKVAASPVLPADAEPYGVGVFIAPQPKASMVNALPWLANFPHNCAEQTFNKILAHAMAIKMVRGDTSLQQMVRRKDVVLHEMPGELSEQTMPWMQLSKKHVLEQLRLTKLLDTAASWHTLRKYLIEIYGLQNQDGGMSWFPGGRSNPYISYYTLAALSKAMADLDLQFDQYEILRGQSTFIPKLVRYCDEQFLRTMPQNHFSEMLQYLYGRSFWTLSHPPAESLKIKIDSLLNEKWKTISRLPIGKQAMMVTISLKFYPGENKALQHLESLRQSAIKDNKGIRWRSVADDDDLNIRTEEYVVRIAEAFEQDKNDKTTVRGIIQWLLQARSDHNWSTTKATADAVSLLYRHRTEIDGKAQQWSAKVNNINLSVTNNLLTGELFKFINLSGQAFPAEIPLSNDAQAEGGINYYYFTQNPQANTGVTIVRTIYKYNSSSSAWEPISSSTILNAGEKIKATLTINTPRMLQYVFIDEKRAAACEPADGSSGYEYENEFSYYKSVRDIGYQFFAEKIPAGISSISYEAVVSKAGNFSWGAATLQCMYQPDVRAFSNMQTIAVTD